MCLLEFELKERNGTCWKEIVVLVEASFRNREFEFVLSFCSGAGQTLDSRKKAGPPTNCLAKLLNHGRQYPESVRFTSVYTCFTD